MREDARMALWLSSFRVDNRVVICTITRGEILFGLGRLAQGRRRAELEAKAQQLFAALPCEPIPPAAGDRYASLKVANRAAVCRSARTTSRSLRPPFKASLVSRDSDILGIEGLAVVMP
jgi:predicted nucleic acid-binding protein